MLARRCSRVQTDALPTHRPTRTALHAASDVECCYPTCRTAAGSVTGRQGASSSVQHLILAHALADATNMRAKVHSSSSVAQHCPWDLAPEPTQQLMLDGWSSVVHMNL
jgi:hypothetical protein